MKNPFNGTFAKSDPASGTLTVAKLRELVKKLEPYKFDEDKDYWMAVFNKRRKWKGHTRHYTAFCCFCGKRKKNIQLHYSRYHPEIPEAKQTAIAKGGLGSLYGVRIFHTDKKPFAIKRKRSS